MDDKSVRLFHPTGAENETSLHVGAKLSNIYRFGRDRVYLWKTWNVIECNMVSFRIYKLYLFFLQRGSYCNLVI